MGILSHQSRMDNMSCWCLIPSPQSQKHTCAPLWVLTQILQTTSLGLIPKLTWELLISSSHVGVCVWRTRTERGIFSCGETERPGEESKQIKPCVSGTQFVYAWARNAPSLELPEDVGFKVGGGGDIKYLVLQVHYASVDKIPDTGDRSGVVLSYTNIPQPKRAGVYYLATGGVIEPRSTTHMETACKLNTSLTIHPFAFRTQTHAFYCKLINVSVVRPFVRSSVRNGSFK